jgi:hypothetical protein
MFSIHLGGMLQYSSYKIAKTKVCPNPTKVFTGREDILLEMHAVFAEESGQLVYVLYGLGGIGKSQIAFKFIQECQDGSGKARYVNDVNQ